VSELSWQRRFDDPIPVHAGRQLVTPEDAATTSPELPKKEAAEPEWQAAIS
jgi:hypothetical protein